MNLIGLIAPNKSEILINKRVHTENEVSYILYTLYVDNHVVLRSRDYQTIQHLFYSYLERECKIKNSIIL